LRRAAVRQGKVFDLDIADGGPGKGQNVLGQMAEKLLANTVIEPMRSRSTSDGAQTPMA
jgi:phosphoribosylformylglycinamidine (FGAM) synthase PurS component